MKIRKIYENESHLEEGADGVDEEGSGAAVHLLSSPECSPYQMIREVCSHVRYAPALRLNLVIHKIRQKLAT